MTLVILFVGEDLPAAHAQELGLLVPVEVGSDPIFVRKNFEAVRALEGVVAVAVLGDQVDSRPMLSFARPTTFVALEKLAVTARLGGVGRKRALVIGVQSLLLGS